MSDSRLETLVPIRGGLGRSSVESCAVVADEGNAGQCCLCSWRDRSLKNRAKGSPYLGIKEERGIRVDFLA